MTTGPGLCRKDCKLDVYYCLFDITVCLDSSEFDEESALAICGHLSTNKLIRLYSLYTQKHPYMWLLGGRGTFFRGYQN